MSSPLASPHSPRPPITTDEFIVHVNRLLDSCRDVVDTGKEFLANTKTFIKEQMDYVERHDELIHGIMLATFSLSLIYYGGLTSIIAFTASLIGLYSFSEQLLDTAQKITALTKTLQLGIAATGLAFFAKNPWIFASALFGSYVCHLVKAHQSQIQSQTQQEASPS